MLQLPPPDHGGQDPLDSSLRIFLLSEVLHDGVVRHLAADSESFLEILLNFVLKVLVFLRGESFRSSQVTRLGCGERGDLQSVGMKTPVVREELGLLTWKILMASSTWESVANGLSSILARLSLILTTASSCLTEMGMASLLSPSSSSSLLEFLMRTYLFFSFSAAPSSSLGPQRDLKY